RLSAKYLEAASGNRIYYVGQPIFLQDNPGLRRLPERFVPDWRTTAVRSFDFKPPRSEKTYFVVAAPVLVEGQRFGVLVIATPKDELRDAWLTLMQRLGIAFLIGIAVS